jgi:predicted nucleotide-binding protein
MREKKILWIDDEEDYVKNVSKILNNKYGWEFFKCYSVGDVINIPEKDWTNFFVVFLDVKMEPPYGSSAGQWIASYISKTYPNLPIIALSSVGDCHIINWFLMQSNMLYLPKETSNAQLDETLNKIRSKGKIKKTFIVHGRDDKTKLELKNFIQNNLKFDEPDILHEKASHGLTIIEKFEYYSNQADIAFVLLTPDNKMADGTEDNQTKRMARQNVIFEAGYFYGRLNRRSGKILLLHRGNLDIPSDISGVIYINIDNGIEAAGEEIRRELSDWL